MNYIMLLLWKFDFWISETAKFILNKLFANSMKNHRNKNSKDHFDSERYDLINDYLPMNVYND